MLRDNLETMFDSLPAISGKDRCQVCLFADPVWEIPTQGSKAAERLAHQVDSDDDASDVDDRLVVCTDCLSLIEDRDVEAITNTTTEAIMSNGKAEFAKIPKVTRKRMRMKTHMMARQAAQEILASITGDPVRLPSA